MKQRGAKKTLLPIVAILVISMAFIAGMTYGFKLGTYNSGMLTTIINGSISSQGLVLLDIKEKKNEMEEAIDFIKFNYEFDIDEAIWAYSEFEKKGNKLLSKHFIPELYAGKQEYMQKLAKYRTTHPILSYLDLELDEAEKVFHENRVERIKSTLRGHGVPESSLSTYATEYLK